MRALPAAVLTLACLGPSRPEARGAPEVPRFEDVGEALGLGGLAPYRVTLVDLDGDGFDDLLAQTKDPAHPGNPGGPLRVFGNAADAAAPGGRRFAEVADAVPPRADGEVAKDALPKGVFAVAGDVDGDGVVDLYRAVYQEREGHPTAPDTGERSAVLRGVGRRGAPRFEVLRGSGAAAGEPATTCAACLADVDRDGRLDLFVGRWYVEYGKGLECHGDRLLRGDGKGGFEDVTERAGISTVPEPGRADSSRPTYGVSHGDVDDDGRQDLLVAVYGRQGNRLWRNRGDGTFEDWGPRTGFDGDEDRSGAYPAWIREEPRLAGREDEPPFRSNGNTFSAVPADVDADGDLDVFLCEITHGWAGPSSDLSALLVNERASADTPLRFRRVTKPFVRPRPDERKWNQGDITAAWGDLDSDGRLDLVLGSSAYPDDQRLRIYRQTGLGSFADVTAAWGVDVRDCHSVTVSDVDGDGALDLLGAGQPTAWNGRKTAVAALYRNGGTPGAHWVEIALEGTGGSNRLAIGARVWLTAGGRTQMRDVVSSTGHFGLAPSRTLHFGLGAAARVDRLRVRWPDAAGTEEVVADVPVNRRLTLRQGERRTRPR